MSDASERGPSRGIISPRFDALLGGGASLVVLAVMFVLPAPFVGYWMTMAFLPLSVLLNWPHFAASYHLLYTTPGASAKHPFAAKYVPVFLIAYAVVATLIYGRAPILLQALHAAAAMYLAWHYTGQTWGTMAVFAHTENLRFDAVARRLIGVNLMLLLVWHATWSASLIHRLIGAESYTRIYAAVSVAAAASAVVGLVGLWRVRRLEGRLPAQIWLPWLAIHGWYAMFYHGEIFWVQLAQFSHAAQYLVFPARVRANRDEERTGRPWTAGSAAAYGGILLGGGVVMFWLLPQAANYLAAWGSAPLGKGVAGVVVADLLVIHHYFIDGCIWKLGDRDVRRDLLRHLPAGPERQLG